MPVFTNTWIGQPEDRGPGDYPSGCPEPHVLDIWRAGGPDIDINAPDIHLPNFKEWVALFHQNGNPFFVPESRGDATGVANAFYAIGQEDAIGYSPFGIDSAARLQPPSTGAASDGPVDVLTLPLTKGFDVLRQLAPLILKHQGTGSVGAVMLNPGQVNESITVGNYTITVSMVQTRRSTAVASTTAEAVPAYAMIIETGPDEYMIAASNTEITFSPNTPGAPIANLAQVQEGNFVNGPWVPGRSLNGDDVLLNYKLAEAAATNQSGSGLRFSGGVPSLQKVKLYRFK